MDIDGKNSWKQCFHVDGVRLPTGYYFGASAATGDLAGNQKIKLLLLLIFVFQILLIYK